MIHESLFLFAACVLRRWKEGAEDLLHVQTQFTHHLHNRGILMEKQVCLFPNLGSHAHRTNINREYACVWLLYVCVLFVETYSRNKNNGRGYCLNLPSKWTHGSF